MYVFRSGFCLEDPNREGPHARPPLKMTVKSRKRKGQLILQFQRVQNPAPAPASAPLSGHRLRGSRRRPKGGGGGGAKEPARSVAAKSRRRTVRTSRSRAGRAASVMQSRPAWQALQDDIDICLKLSDFCQIDGSDPDDPDETAMLVTQTLFDPGLHSELTRQKHTLTLQGDDSLVFKPPLHPQDA